jgi:hypothetical protein
MKDGVGDEASDGICYATTPRSRPRSLEFTGTCANSHDDWSGDPLYENPNGLCTNWQTRKAVLSSGDVCWEVVVWVFRGREPSKVFSLSPELGF